MPSPPDSFPPPDPNLWWSEAWPAEPEAADPLGGRTPPRARQNPTIDNGIDPSLYRLWGLQPLQSQVLRRNEAIIEVWARPSRGVRQTVIRLTLRDDDKAFVQGRAGLGCCEPRIGRRVTFNEPLAEGYVAQIRALVGHRAWAEPRFVLVEDPAGAVAPTCADGVSWDLTLLVPGQVRHLRRACLDEEVGSVADILTTALGAALGQDPRFDVIFPRGADFAGPKRSYEALIAGGGRLRPSPTDRAQPAPVPIPALDEPAPERQSAPGEEPS